MCTIGTELEIGADQGRFIACTAEPSEPRPYPLAERFLPMSAGPGLDGSEAWLLVDCIRGGMRCPSVTHKGKDIFGLGFFLYTHDNMSGLAALTDHPNILPHGQFPDGKAY